MNEVRCELNKSPRPQGLCHARRAQHKPGTTETMRIMPFSMPCLRSCQAGCASKQIFSIRFSHSGAFTKVLSSKRASSLRGVIILDGGSPINSSTRCSDDPIRALMVHSMEVYHLVSVMWASLTVLVFKYSLWNLLRLVCPILTSTRAVNTYYI